MSVKNVIRQQNIPQTQPSMKSASIVKNEQRNSKQQIQEQIAQPTDKLIYRKTIQILKQFKPKNLIKTGQKQKQNQFQSHNLPIINEKVKQQKLKRKKSKQRSLKKSPKVVFKFLSPPAKPNPLVHQPSQKDIKVSAIKPINRQVIPPSDLIHQKMKNFDDNPQRFMNNLDQALDKVFKKSKSSMIRTGRVVPVKDWDIRDSTDLLDGYTEQ